MKEDRVIGTYLVLWKDDRDTDMHNGWWYVQCLKCGNVKSTRVRGIYKDKSCGCQKSPGNKKSKGRPMIRNVKGNKFYWVWVSMRQRCNNVNDRSYKDYGGRGISVSEDWSNFDNFKRDMLDGYAQGLSLDRINVNGDYCKENCRWATRGQQAQNMRSTKLTMEIAREIKASNKPTRVLAKKYGVSAPAIQNVRDGIGWVEVGSVITPVLKRQTNYKKHQTRLYRIWAGMKQRCLNQNHNAYHCYGGKGITIYEPWLIFDNFKRDLNASYNDGMSLDRIDNNLGYTPSNVRWVLLSHQARNTSRVKLKAEDVEYIRSTNFTTQHYRHKFNISYSTVFNVKNRISWQ